MQARQRPMPQGLAAGDGRHPVDSVSTRAGREGIMKRLLFRPTILLVVALFAAGCGETKPEANAIVTDGDVQPEVTQAGVDLLESIADWHMRWDNSLPYLDVHEDMVTELSDLVESRIDLLPKPLARETALYLSVHDVETMMYFDAALRAANFVFEADLVGEDFSGNCALPPRGVVLEALQEEWDLISFQCQVLGFYREFVLDSYRKLSEDTWLKPYLGAR